MEEKLEVKEVEVEDMVEVSWPFPWKDPEYDEVAGPNWNYFIEDGTEYEIYSDGTHEMTQREWDEYSRQVEESDGYDVKEFENVSAYGIIQPLAIAEKSIPDLERLSTLALSKYNKDKGTRLQLKEIKKAMMQVVTGMTYYLTFDVMDPDDEDHSKVQVFQARILELFKKDEYEIEEIRPKPAV